MMQGKKITLVVTGSIAVYKSIELVRELIKDGASVHVVMTKAATEFVAGGGRQAIICSVESIATSLQGKTGTVFVE